MDKKFFLIGLVLIVLSFIGGGAVNSFGSVSTGEGYVSTTTSSTYANTAYKLFTGSGMAGSIVITDDPTAGYVRLWDATSTATSTYQGESPAGTYGRLIAQTAIDATEQTLTLDAVVNYGLVIETQAGFNGIVVVTGKR